MAPREVTLREHGFELIARIRRWLIAGAVGLTGVLSLAAASAFHGHTRTTVPPSAGASAGPSSAQQPSPGGAVQQPAQAPSAASGLASSPVVSGGS
jgi:hypothetical protein